MVVVESDDDGVILLFRSGLILLVEGLDGG